MLFRQLNIPETACIGKKRDLPPIRCSSRQTVHLLQLPLHLLFRLLLFLIRRLRFGIGNDFPRGGQVDFVLGHFTDEDWKTMDERLKMAGEIIKSFCLAGIDITMNQFNKK